MNAIEHLTECVWSKPRHYFGYSPDGEYCVAARHRDSDILADSNFECIAAELTAAAARCDASDSVYTWTASHWAVGYCEYLMVKPDAPESVLTMAGEYICAIADCPVYNESDYSEREDKAVCELWADHMSVRDRLEMISKYAPEVSRFAARRPEIPHDANGAIYLRLRDSL